MNNAHNHMLHCAGVKSIAGVAIYRNTTFYNCHNYKILIKRTKSITTVQYFSDLEKTVNKTTLRMLIFLCISLFTLTIVLNVSLYS